MILVGFDLTAVEESAKEIFADPYSKTRATILSLRRLKSSIFWSTLTDQCLTLFRQP